MWTIVAVIAGLAIGVGFVVFMLVLIVEVWPDDV